MLLSEFIEETLCQIAHGVVQARTKTSDILAIAPDRINGKRVDISDVEFDLTVELVDKSESEKSANGQAAAKAKVLAIFDGSASLGGSAKAGSQQSNRQTQRITFKVPVHYSATVG